MESSPSRLLIGLLAVLTLAACVACGGEADRAETEWVDRRLERLMPSDSDLLEVIGSSRQTLGPATPGIFDRGFAAKSDYDSRPGGMAIVGFRVSRDDSDEERQAQIEIRAWSLRTSTAAHEFWSRFPPDVARAGHPYPSTTATGSARPVFEVSLPAFVDRNLGVCVEALTEQSEECSEGYLWIAMCNFVVELGYMTDPAFPLARPPAKVLRGVTEIVAQRVKCTRR